MGRPDRRLTTSPRPPFTDRTDDPSVATASPRLQVRRLPLALGTLACAGAALSLPVPLQALSLGDVVVESALGQPLRARVPVQLAPGETAGPDCVVSTQQENLALSRVADAQLHLVEAAAGAFDLRISTARPLYEPMYEIHLRLRCPGSVMIVRQYVLLLDLPGDTAPAGLVGASTAATAVMPAPATATTEHKTYPAPTPAPQPLRTRGMTGTRPSAPLTAGSHYRVQSGDTLSTIAARIRDRKGSSIWQIAERIFADNPQAFIGANPDRIRLGADIVLPAPFEATQSPSGAAADEVVAPVTPTTVAAPAPAAAEPPVAEAVATDLPVDGIVVTASPAAAATSPEATTAWQQASPADTVPPKPVRDSAPRPATESSVGNEAPAWQAILLGVLMGILASLVLLRERLRDVLSIRSRRRSKTRSGQTSPAKMTVAPAPLPLTIREARKPAIVVEESPREASVAESVTGSEAALVRSDPVDETSASTPAVAVPPWSPAGQAGEAFDLDTLSLRTSGEQNASNTLQEVLELLESDYEQELTSSQILDRTRFTVDVDELADEIEDDDTLIKTGTGTALRGHGRR